MKNVLIPGDSFVRLRRFDICQVTMFLLFEIILFGIVLVYYWYISRAEFLLPTVFLYPGHFLGSPGPRPLRLGLPGT